MNDFSNPDDSGKNNQSKKDATLKPQKEALWTSEMQLQTLFDAAPIGIYLVDADFCIRAVNPAALPVFGGITDLIGRDFDEVIHILWSKEYADEIVRLFRHTLRTGEPYFTPERTALRRDRNVTEYYEWQINRIPLPAASYGVVCYFRDIIERKQTEKALRHSEEKYRTLFNSIDEGVITFEVIFDEQERAVDCIYLENNPAFSRLTGLPPDVIGKRVSEVVPNLEQSWFDAFESVLKTGEPERFELTAAGIGNRWLDIYISRVGGTGSRTLVAVYNNITTRKRHEANLSFLAETSEDLVKLTTIGETMNRLGAKIGAYFGLGHCLFFEIDEKEANVVIRYCWHRPDLPEIAGLFRVADFVEPGFAEQSRAGKTVVARDLTDETVGDPERFVALGVRSFVAVPLVRDGKWRFSLGAYASEERDWTDDEIELLREITSRIWIKLQRARDEELLRESEEKYRSLFNSLDEGFCLIEVLFDEQGKAFDYRFLEMNPVFERQSGLENARGKTILELVPDLEPQWAETYGQVARTGEAVRFEADVHAMNRVFDIYAFPANAPDTVAVLFSDITERKQMITDLRESEERLRLAVAAGELGTWDWNLATGEVFWNERHFTLLGMPPRPNPLRAEEFFRHIHPGDAERVRGQLEKAVADKTIFQAEFRAVTDAGEMRWMDGYGQTVETDASGKTVRMSGVMFDVTELKRAEEVKREKETLQKMVGAQEDERRRIAQDLHDHLGQHLTALRLKIESIKIMCDGDEALSERVDEAQAVAARIDADIDFLAWQMRPSALDDIGLAAALANYVGEWSAQFQIPADFTAGRFGKNRLAADAETHLYRIAQEALNNVYKHARATNVDVALERRDGFAVLIVEDDGIGFAPDKVSGKKNQKRIGLAGMKERAALVGGKVEIESAPGKGTTVFARVPVADSEKPIKIKKKKDE